jgi:hypothetical protein
MLLNIAHNEPVESAKKLIEGEIDYIIDLSK